MALLIQQLSAQDFPPLLGEMTDPPEKLYVAGALPDPNVYRYLAVVGSRAATQYGKSVVDYLIEGLAGAPVCIVSGLALGVDGHAHKAALRAGLPTVAIPGSGLDASVLYPKSHARLAEQIVENGGALLSEYESTQGAARWTFPQRNRLLAGISFATLIVEAAHKSGALITARCASDYNREVLCVPHSIFAETGKGPHQFLRLGATPITHPDDILEALHIERKEQEETPKHFSSNEQHLWDLLVEPLSRDDLLAASKLSAQETNVLLSKMELDGHITERMNRVQRN